MIIKDHVFLITGGGSGLGEACARFIHENGGKVVIVDLNESTGSALANDRNRNKRTPAVIERGI